jgi:two-component system, chemotaxis family, sensor kinase CheA
VSFDASAYLDLFREEADEYVQRLNQGLLHLEKFPMDADRINDVFRAAHSLKGSARMMQLEDVARVAHRLEDLLDGLRSGRLAVTSPLIDVALLHSYSPVRMPELPGHGRPAASSPTC